MSSLRKTVLRQRPRLLYAGSLPGGAYRTSEQPPADNTEFVFVGAGSGKAEMKDGTYPVCAGDWILCNRGCAHFEVLDNASEKELLFLGVGNLHLSGYAPETILSEREYCIVHTREFSPAVGFYMRQLLHETEGAVPLGEAVAEHLLKILLLYAVRLTTCDNDAVFSENARYLEAKRYFDEHFTEIDSLDDVCKTLVVNKYYLTHLFSQNAGVPPVRYLIGKRIELACKYLETTDDNVADIGKACGYPDPCYFSRIFKQEKRVTPLRYRYLFKLEKSGKKE